MPRGLCFPFGTIAGLEIVAPSPHERVQATRDFILQPTVMNVRIRVSRHISKSSLFSRSRWWRLTPSLLYIQTCMHTYHWMVMTIDTAPLRAITISDPSQATILWGKPHDWLQSKISQSWWTLFNGGHPFELRLTKKWKRDTSLQLKNIFNKMLNYYENACLNKVTFWNHGHTDLFK